VTSLGIVRKTSCEAALPGRVPFSSTWTGGVVWFGTKNLHTRSGSPSTAFKLARLPELTLPNTTLKDETGDVGVDIDLGRAARGRAVVAVLEDDVAKCLP